jgi:endonuclease/exonuclease/phosphatase (EEP) superfamily protein YafD
MRLAVLAALCGLAAAIAFGYLGRLHPALDSFSHFRIHLAVGMLALVVPLLVLRFWPEALFATALGLASIVSTTGLPERATTSATASDAAAAGPVFRLLHLNLRYDNATPGAVLSLIGRERPDILTLNEVSEYWLPWLDRIASTYPHRLICPQPSRIGGVAILSRRPFIGDGACHERGSMGVVTIDAGGRRLTAVALHLGWPWPFSQPWQTYRLMQPLQSLPEGDVLLGADLNAVPWSHTARTVAQVGGLEVVRGIGPTWLTPRLPDALRPLIGLPIDNVMKRGAVNIRSVERLEMVGSDHLPLLVEFSFDPPDVPEDVEQAVAGLRW